LKRKRCQEKTLETKGFEVGAKSERAKAFETKGFEAGAKNERAK